MNQTRTIMSTYQTLQWYSVNYRTVAWLGSHDLKRNHETGKRNVMLTIVRGLPGSGKSTYAKDIGCLHIEADMWHVRNGVYDFKRENLYDAHEWCLQMASNALQRGLDVVVSNTFTTIAEMIPYIAEARKHQHDVLVMKAVGRFGSVHNVPADVMRFMEARWQDYDGERVIEV